MTTRSRRRRPLGAIDSTLAELARRSPSVLGPVVGSDRGPRANPLMAELRQQRLVAARLVASSNIPDPDHPERPRVRGGVRGVYNKAAK